MSAAEHSRAIPSEDPGNAGRWRYLLKDLRTQWSSIVFHGEIRQLTEDNGCGFIPEEGPRQIENSNERRSISGLSERAISWAEGTDTTAAMGRSCRFSCRGSSPRCSGKPWRKRILCSRQTVRIMVQGLRFHISLEKRQTTTQGWPFLRRKCHHAVHASIKTLSTAKST